MSFDAQGAREGSADEVLRIMGLTYLGVFVLAGGFCLLKPEPDWDGDKRNSLQGRYGIDWDTTIEATLESVPAGEQEGRRKWLEGLRGKLTFWLELSSDGSYVSQAQLFDRPEKRVGRWALEGERLVLQQTHENGRPNEMTRRVERKGKKLMMRDIERKIMLALRQV
jgi:hypothetical protein